MLLRIAETVNDTSGDDGVLHSLVCFRFQVSGMVHVGLQVGYYVDKVLERLQSATAFLRDPMTQSNYLVSATNELLRLCGLFADFPLFQFVANLHAALDKRAGSHENPAPESKRATLLDRLQGLLYVFRQVVELCGFCEQGSIC